MNEAKHGYLPKIFQTRSKYGTPTAGIVFNTLVVVAFCSADFGQLLELLNSVYALSLLMEYAAFVKLRLFHKECKSVLVCISIAFCTYFLFNHILLLAVYDPVQRPYRIPIPDWAAVILVIPPVFGIFVIFAISNWYVYVFCTGAVIFGILLFKLSEISKRRGWCNYESRDTRCNHYAQPLLEDEFVTEPTEWLSADSPTDSDPVSYRNNEEFVQNGDRII